MAGKISELTAATALALADQIEVLQGGANLRATLALLQALVAPDPADPTTGPVFVDDFMWNSVETGEIGSLGWSFGNGSAVSVSVVGNSDHPGIMQRTSGTTAAQVAWFGPSTNATTNPLLIPNFSEMTWVVLPQNTSASYTTQIGLFNSMATPGANSIYFERDTTETNWYAVVRNNINGVTRTAMDTFNANWFKLKIRRISANVYGFTINGGTEVTITQTIQQTNTQSPGICIIPPTTTAQSIYVDFFSMKLNALTR